jgi:hypothetical protein
MENRKVTCDNGIEVELDAEIADEIEAARAADEDQLRRVRTAIASMPDPKTTCVGCIPVAYPCRTDADNAQNLAAAIRASDDWRPQSKC